MNSYRIKELISEKITGEWGIEPSNHNRVKVLRTTNFTNSGKINFDKVVERDISKSLVEKKKLLFGDIIIEKSGGGPTQPVGRVVIFDYKSGENYLCNNFTTILRTKENVFPKYLFYLLFNNHLTKKTLNFQNKTTGILNLQLDRYLNEKITLPPLSEQKRITEILDKADSVRQKRKESIALLDEFLKSVFIDMFGDPVKNEKGFQTVKINGIAKVSMGGTPNTNVAEYYGGNINWMKSGDIKRDFIYSVNNKITELTTILKLNTASNQSVACFELNKKLIIPIYLHFNLKLRYKELRNITGDGERSGLNLTILRSLKLNLPPIPLQTQFAKIVER
ncbi:MAG: restriction endonuclease subunit S [Bacteroidota bacterium]|nr:restriction endonuclease subunit S [Bacteroidota bacterium]